MKLAQEDLSTVTIAWDPNPEPIVVGYRVYRFDAHGVGTQIADVSEPCATVPVTGRDTFRITAYSANGLESPFSDPLQIFRAQLQTSTDMRTWHHDRHLHLATHPAEASRFWRIAFNPS